MLGAAWGDFRRISRSRSRALDVMASPPCQRLAKSCWGGGSWEFSAQAPLGFFSNSPFSHVDPRKASFRLRRPTDAWGASHLRRRRADADVESETRLRGPVLGWRMASRLGCVGGMGPKRNCEPGR